MRRILAESLYIVGRAPNKQIGDPNFSSGSPAAIEPGSSTLLHWGIKVSLSYVVEVDQDLLRIGLFGLFPVFFFRSFSPICKVPFAIQN